MLGVLRERENETREPEQYEMQLRDHKAVASKRDFFMVDPRKLKVDGSYNVRDMKSAETKAHVASLKGMIAEGGVKVPLEVRLEDDDIYVVAGHCRLAAVMELISEGFNEIKTVPAIPETKGTSEAERKLNLVISNSGKPLAPLEVAKVVKRLLDFGWDDSEIAKRLGWKSKAPIKQHLEMLAMPEDVKDQVRDGSVSATTARKEVKRSRSEAAANIRKAKEAQRAKGKKKVTPKAIKAVTEREIPPAEQPKAPEPVHSSGLTEQEQRDRASVLAEARQRETDERAEAPDLPSALAGTQNQIPQRNGVKELIEALKPFAQCAELNDLNERADDDAIEVSVRDVKRAWTAYTAATGGEA